MYDKTVYRKARKATKDNTRITLSKLMKMKFA
jgi:hypothetical protein